MFRPTAGTRMRLFALALSLTIFAPARASLSFAQERPEATSRWFSAAWEDGTPVTVTGELSVRYLEDFATQRVERVHRVRDRDSGRWFRLWFEQGAPPALRAGTVVSARGRAHGSDLYLLGDGSGQLETLAPPSSGDTTLIRGDPAPASADAALVLPQSAVVSGDQSTLVMVANFSDVSVSCPTTEIDELMFTDASNQSVDDLFRETSHGQLSLTGPVVGPLFLGYASTDACDLDAWADAADAAASASVDPNAYSRRVYVMPPNSCPASGAGDLGGVQTRSWVFTCAVADVYAHELGHNLGLRHAASPASEYGDPTDIMGLSSGRLRQINAPHRRQTGWLPDAQVQVVSQSGFYPVAPLELAPEAAVAPQTLTLVKADTNEHYYVSYRRAIGFDANICCTYLDRLSVHRWAGGSNTTYLLAVLDDGESFVDTVNGITITQVSHSTGSSLAQVQLSDSPCSATMPSVTLAPSPQSGLPGAALAYTFGLVNHDTAACAIRTFALTHAVPPGWTGTLSPTALTVPPGAIGEATLTVTSAASATAGSYPIGVDASDGSVAAHTVTAGATYAVAPACDPQPAAASLSPSPQSGPAGTTLTYAVSVQNTDGAGCPTSTLTLDAAPPAGWTAELSPAALSLAPGATGTATYTVTSSPDAAAATYGVWLQVSDSAQPAHAGSTSGLYTVETGPPPPAAPGTPSPADGETDVDRNADLSWSGDPAGSFDVYFGQSSDPPLHQSGVTSTSLRLSKLPPNKDFYWKVVATTSGGSASSPVWVFRTGGGASGDGGGPGGGKGKKNR